MDAHCELILNEYKEKHVIFERMRDVIIDKIKETIKNTGMYVAGIEARIKTEKSLTGKLELKGMKYRTLSDITDIVGARIITFYNDEIDKVAALIENLFDIDWENSVDKRKVLEFDKFGYMSLHYICRIPKKLFYDENMPEINEIRFELQMKTALQHVWATIEHDMGYKTDVEIPKEYARSISRLASLLELADEEFKRFRTGITEYRRKVLALVKDGKFDDIELDGDSFDNYLNVNPFDDITNKIAAALHAEIQQVSAKPYLDVLKNIGVKTLGDIERAKKEYGDDVYRLSLYQIGDKDIDIISSTIALHNLILIYVLKKGGGEFGVKIVYDWLYGQRERNLSTAKRIVSQAKHLNIISED